MQVSIKPLNRRSLAVTGGLKPVFKRPWQHHVIILCYIAAPLVNVALLKVFLPASLGVIFSHLVSGYGILAALWLFTAPLVGIALYFVRRFAWYLFLCHSGLILLDYVIKWATHPLFYLRTVPGLHNIILLTGNLALLVVVAYLLQRDFRAPYFQILNRTWRERSRVPIYHNVTLDGQPRIMSDLSDGGCFVLEQTPGRAPGVMVALSFTSNALNIGCMGEIMRVTDTGLGIRFVRLPLAKRRDIRRMLRARFSLRQKVDVPCTCALENRPGQSRILDISRGGCYVQADVNDVKVGAKGVLEVAFADESRSVSGHVVWVNQDGFHQKPSGFGFHFDGRSGSFVKKTVARYGLGALVR
jgi:Tfp pilus assembly protein PilZ